MKRLILILSVCLLSLVLKAQNEYGKVSPQTADFIKYGNIPVSLYTGQVNVSVPLYHIEDPDFDIPLVLNYVSDGFQPAKRAGFVGLNWSIGGMGAVTREIYGVPDDFKEYTTTSDPAKGFWQAVQLKPYLQEHLYFFWPGVLKNYGGYCALPYVDNCFYDCEPDLFMFAMPGHNGTFMIDNQGVVRASDKGYKVDLSGLTAQTEYLGYPADSEIRITAPDGYVYTFGGALASLEYNMNFSPAKEFTAAEKKSCINAWHLTKITAPNGRTLVVNYTSDNIHNMWSPIWAASRTKLLVAPNPMDPYTYKATKMVFPESIEIADTGLRVEFRKSVETCRTFYQEFQKYNNLSYQLDAIDVKQGNKTVYTYSLSYSNRKHLRFLQQVTMPDEGKYSFEYRHPATYAEPSTDNVDDFGYLKGLSSTNPVSLMTKMTYPTGGYTLFEYEPHSYSKRVDTEVTDLSFHSRLVDIAGKTNGFRIKSLENHYRIEGTNFYSKESKTYTYTEPLSVKGSGILLKYRPYFRRTNGDTIYIWNNVWLQNYNIEEPRIGYSYVKETLGDKSYIQYHFSDYHTCPDQGDVNYSWTASTGFPTPLELVSGNATMATSKCLRRGYLLWKRVYNSQSVEQQRTEYTYRNLFPTLQPAPPPEQPFAKPDYFVSLRPVSGGAMAMRIRMQKYPVSMEKTTSYFKNAAPIVFTKEYTYNNYDRLKQQTESTSTQDTLKTTFSYPTDSILTLLQNNIYRVPETRNMETPPAPDMLATIPIFPADSIHIIGTIGVYQKLVNRNIVGRVIAEERFLGNKLLEGKWTQPKLLSNGGVVDAAVYTRKGSYPYEKQEACEVHDAYGNPIYVTSRNRPKKVLVWGYHGRYLVAEIEGVTYNEVKTALGRSPESMSDQDVPDMTALDGLRTSLPHALVTTYTYEPLVGMTSHTAPHGEKTTYEYNDKGQLSTVKNHEGKVVESYIKHYQNTEIPNEL